MTKTAKDIAETRVDEACEVLYAFRDQAKKRLEAEDMPGVCAALMQVAAAKHHLRTATQTLKDVTP
jgi:hypothetical protein